MRARWMSLLLLALSCLEAGDFEFVVIGDTRPRFESESFRPFEGLITKINTLKPVAVINLGDLIYGYGPLRKEHQWDKYEAVVRTLQVPYYQLPGNHDTHSKDARRTYGRRFGKFYQSFDLEGIHFVLLDNTENQRWGYLGPGQLNWLKNDLAQSRARATFVFLHFPVWEPERISPSDHEFWRKTLHPLFLASRVRAVFAGHFHTYGPTREFDGIRYYITGGGGAELRPDYRKSGGSHHFLRVRVAENDFDVRVVTEHGELSDPEADLMGGLQFAARHVSRIGVRRGDLTNDVPFSVEVQNPYPATLNGQATWLLDASAFAIQPERVAVTIPPGAARTYSFTLKTLRRATTLPTLPQLEFNVASGAAHHRFHREIRFLQEQRCPFQSQAPTMDGRLTDWEALPPLPLGEEGPNRAELRSCFDETNLYLAVTVPRCDDEEAKESGFSDELQLGLARALGGTDFGGDLARLGFDRAATQARDRTPGHEAASRAPGTRSVSRTSADRTTFEIAVPWRLLKGVKAGEPGRLLLDLSFPAPENDGDARVESEPAVNSFSYRVRYGSDSLVPVYFVELRLERRPSP